MDDCIERSEFSRTIDDLRKQLVDGDKGVARHAKNNYTTAVNDLRDQVMVRIEKHDVIINGDGSSPGLKSKVELVLANAKRLDDATTKLQGEVGTLNSQLSTLNGELIMLRQKSPSSGTLRAVREQQERDKEPWHKSTAAKALFAALTSLIIALTGYIAGKQQSGGEREHHRRELPEAPR